MKKKKSSRSKWGKQWYLIKTYNKNGILKRSNFFIRSNTPRNAENKIRLIYPRAQVMLISPLGMNLPV